jgi:hypothetical protein
MRSAASWTGQSGGGDQQGGGTHVDGADEMAAAHVELPAQLTSLFTRDKAKTNNWLKDAKRKLPTSQAVGGQAAAALCIILLVPKLLEGWHSAWQPCLPAQINQQTV